MVSLLHEGLLLLAPSNDGLLAASCLSGIALGWALPTSAALIARDFGSASFGAVMGWAYALLGISLIFTVRFAGTMFDRTGSYRPAFAGLLIFSLVVMAIALVIDRKVPERP